MSAATKFSGLNSIRSTIKKVTLWLVSYLLFLYFSIPTISFAVYRKFITFLAKIYDHDITDIVTGLSAIFHRDFDCFYTKPYHTIVLCLRIKGGKLTVSNLQQSFLENVIHKTDSTGQLAYPQLQQHFTRFSGYSFLKWDRKFDISNHVTVHRDDNEVMVTRPVLMELWETLMNKPFHKERSAWEVILVENYLADEREEGENSADWIVFLRCHHSIADGFCLAEIVCNWFDFNYNPNFATKTDKITKRNINELISMQHKKIMMSLNCLLMGPYELLNKLFISAEDYHSLHFPVEKMSFEYFVVESELIPVKEVKQIKQSLGVGFTAVLLAVASGASRRFLLNNDKPIPQSLRTTVPYPSSERNSDKIMGNEFLIAAIDLPVGLDDQRERVLHVHQSLEKMRYSCFKSMLDTAIKMITNIPSTGLRRCTRTSICSTSYSSIPGPGKLKSRKIGGGCDLIESNFTYGLGPDSLGLVINSIAYGNNLRMTLCVDRSLMEGSREKAEQFVKCLMDEYTELKGLALDGNKS